VLAPGRGGQQVLAAADPSGQQVLAAADPSGQRVLVIDDDHDVRALICRALARHGYQVDDAASVAQARTMSPHGYDVLLVDAHLGDGRGTELIDALLAEDPDIAGRCLVVTGGGSGSVPSGVAFLGKPFQPEDLISAVRALCQPGRVRAHPDSEVPGGDAADPGAAAVAQPGGVPAPGQNGAAAVAQPGGVPAPGQNGAAAVARPGPVRAAAASLAGQSGTARALDVACLLDLARMLRAGERTVLADFVHDGPIQELTAVMLGLQMIEKQAPPGLAGQFAEIRQRLDAAARSLRWLVEGDWPFLRPETRLPETLQQRTAWLLSEPITVEVCDPGGALDPHTPLIADVVELALFILAEDGGAGTACVSVRARQQAAEIELALTQAAGTAGFGGDPAAVQVPLGWLAEGLGGAASTECGSGGRRARITLPVPGE
jgi:CheY-like chemotaxis protein